ncbi:hypothetical protein GEMRC1_009105 [Eukaryota sp. GEM-RC1]
MLISTLLGDSFYSLFGDPTNPLVVIIHGITSSSSNMVQIAKSLSNQGLYVLTFDLPGHGESASFTTQISTEILIEHVESLLSSLSLLSRPFHLIGHSMGGCIAVILAASSLFTISSLTLIAPYIAPDNEPFAAKFLRVPLLNKLILKVMGGSQLIQHLADSNKNPATVQFLQDELLQLFSKRPEFLTSTFLNYYCNVLNVNFSHSYSFVGRSSLPVMYLRGDGDLVIPDSSMKMALGCLPEVKVVIAEGFGHEIQVEAPEFIVEHCVQFLHDLN